MKNFATVFVLVMTLLEGQIFAQSIQFDKVSFEEALLKANKQNKLIFIDFNAVWCAPCKVMERNVFTNPKVAELFNKEFINLKLDGEREGRAIAKKFNVGAYPTLMFINGKGEMVYKKVGGLNASQTIKMGDGALQSYRSKYGLVKLKELFPSKRNDEKFLKLYFEKMKEYGESPIEGIESWLKVQTEIKEADVDMMEFLLENSKYLIVDGKAEEIYNTNYDEYWDIATSYEEVSLKNMKYNIVNNTRGVAYKNRNPQALRAFIVNWKELPANRKKTGVLMDYELDYTWFSKDLGKYKVQAAYYLDSIVGAKSLKQIHKDDAIFYKDYKENKYRPSLIGDSVLKNLKIGKEALWQIAAIKKTTYKYLTLCKTRKDYKKVIKWVNYGIQLSSSNYEMYNLKSDVLNKQGKTKEAIKFKQLALDKLSKRHKKRPFLKEELNKMMTAD